MKSLRRRLLRARRALRLGSAVLASAPLLLSADAVRAEPASLPGTALVAQAAPAGALVYRVSRGLSRSQELRIQHEGEVLPGSNDAFVQPPYRLTVPVRTQVQSLEEDGAFIILRSLGPPRHTAERTRHPDDAQRIPSTLGQLRLVETLSSQGDVQSSELSISPDGVPAGPIDLVLDLMRIVLPPMPAESLGHGDSWAQVFPMSFGAASEDRQGHVTVRYTLRGQQSHEGRSHWTIDAELEAHFQGSISPARRGSEPIDVSGYMRGTSTHLVDVQTFLPSRVEGRIGTVMMLGTRDANRRRQAYETTWILE